MGLRNDLTNDLVEAFNTDLADAIWPFTLFKGETHYDPNTGNIILGETTSGSWRGVLSKLRKRYIEDEPPIPVDTQIVCLAFEAPFPPDVNDVVIVPQPTATIGQTSAAQRDNCFIVQRVDIDPAFSVYTLFCQSATHGPVQSRQYA